MKVVIVDDLKEEGQRVFQYVSKYFDDVMYIDPQEIGDRFYKEYDLYFLDIEMEPSGQIIATKMKDINPQAIFIFLTNHESYIFESQIYNPFYFIRKSCLKKDLDIAMGMLKDAMNDYLMVTMNHEDKVVKLKQIQFIEIYRGKVTIHTTHEDISYWGTLSEIEKQLPTDIFIRIHNSYVINKNYVQQIHHNEVYIGQYRLNISRKYIKTAKEQLRRNHI